MTVAEIKEFLEFKIAKLENEAAKSYDGYDEYEIAIHSHVEGELSATKMIYNLLKMVD